MRKLRLIFSVTSVFIFCSQAFAEMDVDTPSSDEAAALEESPQTTAETADVPVSPKDEAFDQIMNQPKPSDADSSQIDINHKEQSNAFEPMPELPDRYFTGDKKTSSTGDKKTSLRLPIVESKPPAPSLDRGRLDEWRSRYYQKHPKAKILAAKTPKAHVAKVAKHFPKKSRAIASNKKNACRNIASQGKNSKRNIATCKLPKKLPKKVAFKNKKQGRLTASQNSDAARFQN